MRIGPRDGSDTISVSNAEACPAVVVRTFRRDEHDVVVLPLEPIEKAGPLGVELVVSETVALDLSAVERRHRPPRRKGCDDPVANGFDRHRRIQPNDRQNSGSFAPLSGRHGAVPHAISEHLQETSGKVGADAQQLIEILAIEAQQLAVANGARRCAPGLTDQQTELADRLARTHAADDNGRWPLSHHRQPTAAHDEHRAALIVLVEQPRSGRDSLEPAAPADKLAKVGRQLSEERDAGEEVADVVARSFGVVWAAVGHEAWGS
jgi:hypothetical protein